MSWMRQIVVQDISPMMDTIQPVDAGLGLLMAIKLKATEYLSETGHNNTE